MENGNWRSVVGQDLPPLRHFEAGKWSPKQEVLVVDAKGRMAVVWYRATSDGYAQLISGKSIGNPTHWLPLPKRPSTTEVL